MGEEKEREKGRDGNERDESVADSQETQSEEEDPIGNGRGSTRSEKEERDEGDSKEGEGEEGGLGGDQGEEGWEGSTEEVAT